MTSLGDVLDVPVDKLIAEHVAPRAVLAPVAAAAARLDSVDLLRGLVMAIMALDHVRDFLTYVRFAPEDMRHTYPALFFTRWITHFCAPVFFFLAGTAAYLSKKKGAALSDFLWKRGVWLMVLQFTILQFAWTFIPTPGSATVIWALGACMVILAVLVRLPLVWVATIGVGTIALHNLLDGVSPASFGSWAGFWMTLHKPGPTSGLFVLYPLVPWFGVMAAGYAFGAILKKPEALRRRILVWLGAGMIATFVLLRATNLYGNPAQALAYSSSGDFAVQPSLALTVISFFNVEKYPPSLQYILMTLGPAILLLAWFEKIDLKRGLGRVFWDKLLVFGRVPMFYYTLHIYLAHLLAIASAYVFGQSAGWLWHGAFKFNRIPEGYGHGLPYVYFIWISVVVMLYFPCKWFALVKARRKDWWLSYL